MHVYTCPDDGNELIADAKNLFFHCSHCGKEFPRYALETGSQKAEKEKAKA